MCLSCLSLTFKKKGKCISFAELGLSRHTLDLQAALRHVGIFFVCFSSPLLGRREWSLSIWCSPRSVAPGTVLGASQAGKGSPVGDSLQKVGPVATGALQAAYFTLQASLTEQGGEPVDIGFTV